jgi:hypothetical protein
MLWRFVPVCRRVVPGGGSEVVVTVVEVSGGILVEVNEILSVRR